VPVSQPVVNPDGAEVRAVVGEAEDHLTEPQQDEMEILIVLCEKYEKETQAVAPPTPLEAIRFRMEQMGYKQKDLAMLVGGAIRASEIMTGKRGLTTEMIRRLRDEWRIPADSLLGGRPPPTHPRRLPARMARTIRTTTR
jgi:HTH-type transcriptional regulator/antitoxin HigA